MLLLDINLRGFNQDRGSADSPPYSDIIVKKRINGKVCDTCIADYALHAIPEFSYMLTGARHNYIGHRFNILKVKYKSHQREPNKWAIHFISQRNVGISFVPTFILEKGKRIQLYRSYGIEDYNNLEYMVQQNSRVIRPWTPLSALGEDRDNVILGDKKLSGKTISIPWKRTYFAGNFNLNVNDTLDIIVRDIRTKKLIQGISVVRPVDKATNFFYYQLPLKAKTFSINLQDILNMYSGLPDLYSGDSSTVFEKDYSSIGLIRYLNLSYNEEVQYSVERPYNWKLVKSIANGDAFIVLGNDMRGGKDHHIYLRYKRQPETIHKITIRVKAKPVEIPWGKVAAICILMIIVGGIAFYLWNKKNKKKISALKRKNEDIETRLSLLSGQLNPHFLFNSLNAIQGSIISNPEKANTYIANVARFMRDVMDNGKKEFVSLHEELKLVEIYLKLEQERSQFSYTISVAENIDASSIDFPPLLLQPVLENSIRHAFGKERIRPEITIQIGSVGANLEVKISDNGSTFWNSGKFHEGHGLSLTRKRMAVYNERLDGMSIQMELNYVKGSGTITTFTFHNWLA